MCVCVFFVLFLNQFKIAIVFYFTAFSSLYVFHAGVLLLPSLYRDLFHVLLYILRVFSLSSYISRYALHLLRFFRFALLCFCFDLFHFILPIYLCYMWVCVLCAIHLAWHLIHLTFWLLICVMWCDVCVCRFYTLLFWFDSFHFIFVIRYARASLKMHFIFIIAVLFSFECTRKMMCVCFWANVFFRFSEYIHTHTLCKMRGERAREREHTHHRLSMT